MINKQNELNKLFNVVWDFWLESSLSWNEISEHFKYSCDDVVLMKLSVIAKEQHNKTNTNEHSTLPP